jgi:hypothetical protein
MSSQQVIPTDRNSLLSSIFEVRIKGALLAPCPSEYGLAGKPSLDRVGPPGPASGRPDGRLRLDLLDLPTLPTLEAFKAKERRSGIEWRQIQV